jgi:intracellular multiplication protein IcmJ
MEPLPLVLSVKAVNWRMFDERRICQQAPLEDELKLARLKVLERDNHTCWFCGFRAPKWQEVHHLNGDHADNRPENLATACSFCHMTQHIGLAGRYKEAALAWLPEIRQADIHHLVRSVLVVRRWADAIAADRRQRAEMVRAVKVMADRANATMAGFTARIAKAEHILGTSDPLTLANILLQMPDALYARRAELLGGIRLLPLGRQQRWDGEDMMPENIDAWMSTGGPYANLNPRFWVSLARTITEKGE